MTKETLNVEIEVLTGLHIGAGNDAVQIGGVDSAVIKDPISKLPYIPGSSLKGKLRSLLEVEGSYGVKDDKINKYFGPTPEYITSKKEDKAYVQTPTSLIFRDFMLAESERWASGEITTEFKTEIRIDRDKGTAQDRALRTIERVPPSVKFVGQILIRYSNDSELTTIKSVLQKAFELLNNDYLGGSGSRGYGAVKIKQY
ncbi:MAG: type III-A CRISPR-associated RAMP protein Csm3 [Ignavibacteriaceae bacterium]|nr:type III-A CRISPR-associated RAMP protein Csm3 [Ignavibacteriaceae bacterium]